MFEVKPGRAGTPSHRTNPAPASGRTLDPHLLSLGDLFEILNSYARLHELSLHPNTPAGQALQEMGIKPFISGNSSARRGAFG